MTFVKLNNTYLCVLASNGMPVPIIMVIVLLSYNQSLLQLLKFHQTRYTIPSASFHNYVDFYTSLKLLSICSLFVVFSRRGEKSSIGLKMVSQARLKTKHFQDLNPGLI